MATINNSADYVGSVNSRVSRFATVYNQMTKSIDKYSAYNTWLHFECNKLVIDTAEPVNQNIILQTWEYDKNGSGTANSFTLRICYDVSDPASQYKNESIHYVENALLINDIITNEEGVIKGYQSVQSKQRCTFQYGYINVGDGIGSILSPKYEGMVLGVEPELRDNMLFYTITGTSGVFGSKDVKLSFPEVKGWKATDLAWDILNKYVGDGYKDHELKDYITEPYKIINKTNEEENNAGPRRETEQDFDAVESATLFQYIDHILGMIKVEDYVSAEGLDKIPEGEKPYYVYYLDEIDGQKCIVIDLLDPFNTISTNPKTVTNDSGEELSEGETVQVVAQTQDIGKYNTGLVFEYPSKNQNFVLSFTPSVNWNVAWGNVIVTGSNGEEARKRYGIDSSGRLVRSGNEESGFVPVSPASASNEKDSTDTSSASSTEPTTSTSEGAATEAVTSQEAIDTTTQEDAIKMSTLSEALNLNYGATMSTVGIPADIPICTKFKVLPILNGVPYIFQGVYMVRKTNDRIDSSGYITEMDLFRLRD